MELLTHNEDYLLNSMVKDAFDARETDSNGISKYFSLRSIMNIPLVHYPTLSDQQNLNIWTFSKEVLLQSKENNDYNEVAITFDVQDIDINSNDAIIVFGDATHVNFASDARVAALLAASTPSSIVSLHNHPNDTSFSVRDLLIFCHYPELKLLTVITPSGNMNILYRHTNAYDAMPLFERCVLQTVPDFQLSKKDILSLTAEQLNEIASTFLEQIPYYNISYQANVTKQTVLEV